MTMLNHYAGESLLSLTCALDRFGEAGIDPSFDTDMEELERQFAELRLAIGQL
jgi:hypothetical protein